MDIKWLIESIKTTYNIIDFITVVYCYLLKFDLNTIRKRYNKNFNESNVQKMRNEVYDAFSNLFFEEGNDKEYLSFEYFKDSFLIIININVENVDLLCYETLITFDKNYTHEEVTFNSYLTKQGPLNTVLSDKLKFYNKPPKRYNANYLEEYKIRIGRQTSISDTNSIINELKNFEIIQTNQMFGYNTNIYKYNGSFLFTQLTFGIVPVDVKQHIEMELLQKEKLINIKYKEFRKNVLMRKLKETLEMMEKDGVDIAVFPELFLFPEMIYDIKKYLICNRFENLKLILTGSDWFNKKNTSHLISSKGSYLLSHTKKMPYDKYKNEEKYTENIICDNEINLIDIDGLGRIGCLICKDVLSDNLNHLYTSSFQTNIVFVSACTSQTVAMYNKAQSDATTKAVSTIMCNASSLVEYINDENNLLCYICVPKAENKHLEVKSHVQNKEEKDNDEDLEYFKYFCISIE